MVIIPPSIYKKTASHLEPLVVTIVGLLVAPFKAAEAPPIAGGTPQEL